MSTETPLRSDLLAAGDFAVGRKNEPIYNEISARGLLYREGWQTARRSAEAKADAARRAAEPKTAEPPASAKPEEPRDLFGNLL